MEDGRTFEMRAVWTSDRPAPRGDEPQWHPKVTLPGWDPRPDIQGGIRTRRPNALDFLIIWTRIPEQRCARSRHP